MFISQGFMVQNLDLSGIEPEIFRMRSERDTTTPQARAFHTLLYAF